MPTLGRLFVNLALVGLVVLSSLTAFIGTCVPIGYIGFAMPQLVGKDPAVFLIIGCGVGIVVAICVGYFVSKALFKRNRRGDF